MKFMLLLHGLSDDDTTPPVYASFDEEMAAHTSFSELIATRMVSSEALQDAPSARTLRPGANGDIVVTDGPFAEVKEQIGGFYVIEAESFDEAVELARSCPLYGGIEVRPVMDFSES